MTEPETPKPAPATAEPTTGAAADASDVAVAPGAEELDDDVLSSTEYSVAFSPRQVAVGLAIVAGLIAVVAARRHGRKRDEDA